MNDKGLEFFTFIPSEPSIIVKSKEILTMTEYISFVLSTFGTWFGISVLALNPFKINIKRKNDTNDLDGHGKIGKSDENCRKFPKFALNFKPHNYEDSDQDQLRQLVITLTGRVIKVEQFVHNNRSIHQPISPRWS